METLELKSWEMVPGCSERRRAFAHGRRERMGAMGLLRLVRVAPGRFALFVRLHERNFLLLRDGAPQIWMVKPDELKLARVAARLGIDSSLSLASVHVVRVESGREVVAIEGASIEGWSYERRGFAWLDDELRNPLRFQEERVPDTASYLVAQLNGQNTFGRWVWEWMHSSSEQKQRLWDEQQRAREEMEQLMTWVLWCLPEVWKQAHEVHLAYHCSAVGSNWFFKREPSPKWFTHPELSASSSGLVARWGVELQQRFIPLHHLQLMQLNPKVSFQTARFGSTVSAPTMHEHLEARLQLRNWLQQNAPDKIEALLPP